jgi:EspG family
VIDSFTLSLAAVDILSESLGQGLVPFPFEVPHNGRSAGQRAGIRDAVLADLSRRDLAVDGRVRPEVADALGALCAPEVAVTAIGLLDDDQQLLARTGRAGEFAVRAVLRGQLMTIDHVRSSAVARSMVELLPDERPAIDQSVTVAEDAALSSRPEGAQFARMVRAPRTGRSAQLAAARVILQRPRVRVGQFGIIPRGRHDPVPELGWFDTDVGRYLMHSRRGEDGRTWVTYAPTDKERLVHLLTEEIERLE